MEPLTATLPQYPTELRRQLQKAERRLALQTQYIDQSRALLALTQHKQTLQPSTKPAA